MAPTPQIQNYVWWLKQRGQTFPVPRPRAHAVPSDSRKVRFLVLLDHDLATLPESQRTLIDRMLTATALPREDFVFESAADAVARIAESEVEGIICLGPHALAAISPMSFDRTLGELMPFSPPKATILCCIHTAEDMERDPQFKRATWQQLQRFMAAVKKEP